MPNTQFGLMIAAFALTQFIAYLPGGWITDLIPVKYLIPVSLISTGLCGFWIATHPPFTSMLIIQAVQGITITLLFWDAMIKGTRMIGTAEEQGRMFGLLEGGRGLFAAIISFAASWMILNAYTRPGDKILIQPPVYNTFSVVIQGAGRFIENNNLILKDGHYEIDFEDLERKTSDPKVRILLVCNPANPVGRVWTREELTKMYEICEKNHTLIVSNEIHGDIVYAPHKHIPYFSLSDEVADHVVVMDSPSKIFNLACFYPAYVVIKNKALRDQYNAVYDNYHFDYNYIGIEALIAAYDKCEYYVDQQNEYFLKNINLVKNFIAENMPEVKVIEPEASYLLWIDFRAWNMTPFELVNLFTEAIFMRIILPEAVLRSSALHCDFLLRMY